MSSAGSGDESGALSSLLAPVCPASFRGAIRRLHTLFDIYARTCPEPLPAPGLAITPAIRNQCELYLPIGEIAAVFSRLYSAAATYPPILSSTPFHNALSWADAFAALPAQFQSSANPARLLQSLLVDNRLLTDFLFASFLPDRFYGGIGRYPGQRDHVRRWLASRRAPLRCLDAACGTGEESYGLALLLSEAGFLPEDIRIEGWTVEPLEVWAAAHRRFPHDIRREERLRRETATLFERGFDLRLSFRRVDLTEPLARGTSDIGRFDLILCNGLLGGPIIHEEIQLRRAIANLAVMLAPGGMLLAADNFHGGWKKKCPQTELRALFEAHELETVEAGEGLAGLKPD